MGIVAPVFAASRVSDRVERLAGTVMREFASKVDGQVVKPGRVDHERFMEMRREGYSMTEAAAEFGVAKVTIHRHCKATGIAWGGDK